MYRDSEFWSGQEKIIDGLDGTIKSQKQTFDALLKKYQALEEAAQAVLDRWETPHWKDAVSTAHVIYALRNIIMRERDGENTNK